MGRPAMKIMPKEISATHKTIPLAVMIYAHTFLTSNTKKSNVYFCVMETRKSKLRKSEKIKMLGRLCEIINNPDSAPCSYYTGKKEPCKISPQLL